MSETPEELAAQIRSIASQLAQRTDLTEMAEPRHAFFSLAAALFLPGPPGGHPGHHVEDYPDDITGGELAAPRAALAQTAQTLHHLLSRL